MFCSSSQQQRTDHTHLFHWHILLPQNQNISLKSSCSTEFSRLSQSGVAALAPPGGAGVSAEDSKTLRVYVVIGKEQLVWGKGGGL